MLCVCVCVLRARQKDTYFRRIYSVIETVYEGNKNSPKTISTNMYKMIESNKTSRLWLPVYTNKSTDICRTDVTFNGCFLSEYMSITLEKCTWIQKPRRSIVYASNKPFFHFICQIWIYCFYAQSQSWTTRRKRKFLCKSRSFCYSSVFFGWRTFYILCWDVGFVVDWFYILLILFHFYSCKQ